MPITPDQIYAQNKVTQSLIKRLLNAGEGEGEAELQGQLNVDELRRYKTHADGCIGRLRTSVATLEETRLNQLRALANVSDDRNSIQGRLDSALGTIRNLETQRNDARQQLADANKRIDFQVQDANLCGFNEGVECQADHVACLDDRIETLEYLLANSKLTAGRV